MPSPRFDAMSVDLSKKIGDYKAAAGTDGEKVTANERNAILNRALAELFNTKWNEVKGDKNLFIQIFPELYREVEITTASTGLYTIGVIGNLDFDFYATFDARKDTGNVYITSLQKGLYQIVKSSKHPHYIPSATKPYVFEVNRVLEFLPATEYNAQKVKHSYIKFPVNPSDGTPFGAAGTYDSPFYSSWHEIIVEIAKQIYLDMSQQKG